MQLVCNLPDRLQNETDYLNNVFSKNNYNADFVRQNTPSNADLNTQTNLNFGPVMMLYWTSEVPLKLSLVYYNLTTYAHALHTNQWPLYDNCQQKCQGQRQARGQTGSSIQDKIDAVTDRPLTLVRPSETSAHNWLNTNEWQKIVKKTSCSFWAEDIREMYQKVW